MRILALIGALAIVVGIGAAIFFFGGFYSVAGTAEDPVAVTWALTHVRNASIDRYALDQPPAAINLSDPATVQAGAKAFATHGCTNCHGGPGVGWAKFSEGLHPDPPDLKEVVDHRSPAQLFWVPTEASSCRRPRRRRSWRRAGRRSRLHRPGHGVDAGRKPLPRR